MKPQSNYVIVSSNKLSEWLELVPGGCVEIDGMNPANQPRSWDGSVNGQ
jgi:hypothetical protein